MIKFEMEIVERLSSVFIISIKQISTMLQLKIPKFCIEKFPFMNLKKDVGKTEFKTEFLFIYKN